jgi:hypothetical protein
MFKKEKKTVGRRNLEFKDSEVNNLIKKFKNEEKTKEYSIKKRSNKKSSLSEMMKDSTLIAYRNSI